MGIYLVCVEVVGTVTDSYSGYGYMNKVDSIAIHCGVVGNMQASHVCAPGSIPGDGVFLFKSRGNGKGRKIQGNVWIAGWRSGSAAGS